MSVRIDTRPWRFVALLASLALAACINFPYSIPVQQGNVITVEMLQELKLGMDKRKVKFVLGTPLVTDAFHQDRWDYFYSYYPGSGDTVQQKASLYFEGDSLVRIDADIQSDIDFHTVTHATDKVVVVPRKKSGGFLAAITPDFVTRDEEQQTQANIQRRLDSGFNEPQPGSAEPGALPPASAAVDPALEPAGAAAPELPSEVYAPNSRLAIEHAESPAAPAAGEPVSSEVRDQSDYLQSLFDGFATASASASPAEEAPAEAEAPSSVVTTPRDPTVPTRD